jgi:hypothetical protein
MLFKMIDELMCQLFHGDAAEVVSYSRQGAWSCTRTGCRAQARHARAALATQFEREVGREVEAPAQPTPGAVERTADPVRRRAA